MPNAGSLGPSRPFMREGLPPGPRTLRLLDCRTVNGNHSGEASRLNKAQLTRRLLHVKRSPLVVCQTRFLDRRMGPARIGLGHTFAQRARLLPCCVWRTPGGARWSEASANTSPFRGQFD